VRNDGAVIDQTQGHGTGDHGSTHRWAALSRGSPTDLRERSPAFEGVATPSLRKPTVAYWARCRASGPPELRGLFHPLDSTAQNRRAGFFLRAELVRLVVIGRPSPPGGTPLAELAPQKLPHFLEEGHRAESPYTQGHDREQPADADHHAPPSHRITHRSQIWSVFSRRTISATALSCSAWS